MNIINTAKINILLLFAITSVFVVACKKEYVTEPTPYNEIISFKVPFLNGADTLYAAIDNDQNTLTIHWPSTSAHAIPDIKPIITTSKNAKVSPDNDSQVSLKNDMTYTVTAQDGKTRIYTLKLFSNYKPSEISSDNVKSVRIGEVFNINFKELAGDGTDKVYLVDDQKKEYQLIALKKLLTKSSEFLADTEDGTGIPSGQYYIKLNNKYNIPTISKEKLITINNEEPYPYIYLNNMDTIRVKPNGTLKLPIRHLPKDLTLELFVLNYFLPEKQSEESLIFDIGAKITNEKELTIKFPADIRTGIYQSFGVEIEDDQDNYVRTDIYKINFPIKIEK